MPRIVRGYSNHLGQSVKLRWVRSRWYVMQIPIPPVSQCKNRQTSKPDHEKYAGKNARRAPICKPPIQRTGVQAMCD